MTSKFVAVQRFLASAPPLPSFLPPPPPPHSLSIFCSYTPSKSAAVQPFASAPPLLPLSAPLPVPFLFYILQLHTFKICFSPAFCFCPSSASFICPPPCYIPFLYFAATHLQNLLQSSLLLLPLPSFLPSFLYLPPSLFHSFSIFCSYTPAKSAAVQPFAPAPSLLPSLLPLSAPFPVPFLFYILQLHTFKICCSPAFPSVPPLLPSSTPPPSTSLPVSFPLYISSAHILHCEHTWFYIMDVFMCCVSIFINSFIDYTREGKK